ncbi:Cytochrome p450 protein [Thalictrum thalictroides]|uniref:Cytochrome p450 protein n=1 Tax=Thalictrum thalictroides TaxID=46969 RepID=A0A7J6W5J1_THATH|nr:Cytochrome p450 protein [Thalictrum thalictroides]
MEFLYYVLLTLFMFLVLKVFSQVNKKNLPPSPFAFPIIGHLHLFKKPFYRTLLSLSNRYRPILFLQFGSRRFLIISSLSLVEECFTKNDVIFANRPSSIALDHQSYNYTVFVWSSYGHHWRNMRRITNIDIFSAKSLLMSAKIRKEEIYRLVSSLFRRSTGDELQHFNLKIMFSKLVFNIIMRLVAGKPCFEEFTDSDEQKRLHIMLKEMFSSGMLFELGDFLPILRKIGLYTDEKCNIEIHKRRDSFLENLLNEFRRKQIHSSPTNIAEDKKNTTIIETLLSIQEAEPEQYSDEIIKGTILVMFIAGTDTSALTLEWAMSLLLNHPDVLQKARSEIKHNVQGRLLEDYDLLNLPYLQCIINETLRLYPVTPLLLPHTSSEECTVGGYTVPQGTVLYANVGAIHRDPKVWTDPTKFMPERFEGEREMGFKFMPFGVGRRICPGANLAMRVVALALGILIQCFEWERVGQEQVEMHETNTGATLPKADPLIAICKPYPSMVETLSQL